MAKLTELPTGIRRKLWDIQRTVKAVEADLAEGDDPFQYAPAEAVIDEVRRQLGLKQLMVVPSVISSSKHGQVTKARVCLEVTDLEAEDSFEYVWEGEGDSVAAAATAARKGWYIATFNIQLKEPSAEKLHQRREARKRDNPTVSSSQIKNYIGRAREEAEVSDEDFAVILARFNVDSVEKLPKDHCDAFVKALRSHRKRPPADQQPTREMAAVAAGPDTEPARG